MKVINEKTCIRITSSNKNATVIAGQGFLILVDNGNGGQSGQICFEFN